MAAAQGAVRRQVRDDGFVVVVLFATLLLLTPARLIFRGFPLAISPAVLVAALGCALLLFSLILGTRPAEAVPPRRSAVTIGLAVFWMLNLASYAVGAGSGRLGADDQVAADRRLFGTTILVVFAFYVTRAFTELSRLDLVLRVTMRLGLVGGLVGLVQFGTGFNLSSVLRIPILRESATFNFSAERSSFDRVNGLASHPIEFGVAMALMVPIAAVFTMRSFESWRGGRVPGIRVVGWLLTCGIYLAGALFAVSRSAILGLAIVVTVLFIGWSWPRRRLFLATGLTAGVVAVIAFPRLMGTFYSLFANVGSDYSILYRTQDYGVAARIVEQYPLFGWGFGSWFAPKYTIFDNQYLLAVVESGAAGIVGLLTLMVVGPISGTALMLRADVDPHSKDLALGLVAALLVVGVSAATFDLFSFPLVTGMFFLILGFVGCLARMNSDRVVHRKKTDVVL